MSKVFNFLKQKWLWVVGILGGTALATNKARNLYWAIIGLILILKMWGEKILGKKYNNFAMIGLLVYFIYCFLMDFWGKSAVGSSQAEGFLTGLWKKIKSLFTDNTTN